VVLVGGQAVPGSSTHGQSEPVESDGRSSAAAIDPGGWTGVHFGSVADHGFGRTSIRWCDDGGDYEPCAHCGHGWQPSPISEASRDGLDNHPAGRRAKKEMKKMGSYTRIR
jgi:hypothetical protein